MNKEELNQFILKKTQRQNYLQERRRNLEDLDLELSGAKFGRAFRTFYYYLKRFLTLVLGFLFLGAALTLFFKPDIVFQDEHLKETLTASYLIKFDETAKEIVFEELINFRDSDQDFNVEALFNVIEDSFHLYVEKEVLFYISLVGVLLFCIALALLYVSRLSKQLRRRNSSISKADSLTQEIISDYKLTIEEEEKELEVLRRILQENKF